MAATCWIKRGLTGLIIGIGLIAIGCGQGAIASQNAPAPPNQPAPAQPSPTQTAPPARPAVAPADPAAAQHDHAAPTQEVLGKPPIEFVPPILDLGVLRPGSRTSGTVFIQNVSDKWLKIVASKPSCTCTSVDLANTSLAPGERVPLRADYHASSVMGEKQAAVKVKFEGYDEVQVAIKASIMLPIMPDPGFISTSPVAGSAPVVNGIISVTSMDRKPFRVLAVNGAAPAFDGFDPDHDQLSNSYRLKWDLSGYSPATCTDAKGNRMPGWIVVETDREDCQVFNIEIRSECTRRERPKKEDSWLIQDKCVLVGGVKPGVPSEFELLVNWFPKAAHTDPIRSVTSESNQFTAELLSVEMVDGNMLCKMKVTPAADYRGLIYGVMRVQSNNQSFPITIIGSSRATADNPRPAVEGAAPLQFTLSGFWWATSLALCGGLMVVLYLVVLRRKFGFRAAQTR